MRNKTIYIKPGQNIQIRDLTSWGMGGGYSYFRKDGERVSSDACGLKYVRRTGGDRFGNDYLYEVVAADGDTFEQVVGDDINGGRRCVVTYVVDTERVNEALAKQQEKKRKQEEMDIAVMAASPILRNWNAHLKEKHANNVSLAALKINEKDYHVTFPPAFERWWSDEINREAALPGLAGKMSGYKRWVKRQLEQNPDWREPTPDA